MTATILGIVLLSLLIPSSIKCSLLITLPSYSSPPEFPDTSTETRLLLSKEMVAFNRSFYQTLSGTWNSGPQKPGSINLPAAFEFEHQTGKIKSFGYLDYYSNFGVRFFLYDGKYINRFIEVTFIGSLLKNVTQSEEYFYSFYKYRHFNITLHDRVNVTQFTQLNQKYNTPCEVDLFMTWNIDSKLANVSMNSKGCGLFIDATLTYVDPEEIYANISFYGHILSFLLMLCIMASIKELKNSAERPDYAKNISLVTLLFNSVWNYFIFLAHFMVIMRTSQTKFPLVLPTVLLFFYTNIFQMQTFVHIWKSRNAEFIATHASSEDVRMSLFSFNCKLYLSILIGLFILGNVLTRPTLLFIYLCTLWVPQIIQNIWNSASKAPSVFYLIAMTLEHLYIPLYMTMFDDNFLELKPNYTFASLLISVVGFQVLLVILQKTMGTRVFLPWFLRRKMYKYERMIKEDEENTNGLNFGDCPICLVPVNMPAPNTDGRIRLYMETPCMHTFHEKCLEEWMTYKRQCPVCRAPLPPLRETD